MTDSAERRERLLVAAGVLFAVGSAVHLVDHLRRGQGSVTDELFWAGNLALIVQVATITLILTRHRLAPLAAASAGFPLALGFGSAHWLPHWSELSDPVWQIDSFGWFSYLASTLEIVGALAVGVAGLAIVRSRGLDSFAAPGTPTAEANAELPVPSGH
jgi:hypothetical protein